MPVESQDLFTDRGQLRIGNQSSSTDEGGSLIDERDSSIDFLGLPVANLRSGGRRFR